MWIVTKKLLCILHFLCPLYKFLQRDSDNFSLSGHQFGFPTQTIWFNLEKSTAPVVESTMGNGQVMLFRHCALALIIQRPVLGKRGQLAACIQNAESVYEADLRVCHIIRQLGLTWSSLPTLVAFLAVVYIREHLETYTRHGEGHNYKLCNKHGLVNQSNT